MKGYGPRGEHALERGKNEIHHGWAVKLEESSDHVVHAMRLCHVSRPKISDRTP